MERKEFKDINKLKKQIEDKESLIKKHQSELEVLNQRLVVEEHKYMTSLFQAHGIGLDEMTELITQLSPNQNEEEKQNEKN